MLMRINTGVEFTGEKDLYCRKQYGGYAINGIPEK